MKLRSKLPLFIVLFWLVPAIAFASLVNINIAGKAELMTLKGIGPVKAQAILDYRASRPFYSISDIKKVKGIGDATYADIKDFIEVGDIKAPPAPTLSPKIVASQPAVYKAATASVPVLAAAAYTVDAGATPLWLYVLGLVAVMGLGIAGVWYVRLYASKPHETTPAADEFEIVE